MLVLIIDRSLQIIERLKEMISEKVKGTIIHRAVSYESAKKLLGEKKYDAVLLDIELPEFGSVRLLKEIKKTGQKTCIIIMFTYMDNYSEELFKSLGAEYLFDKYYEFEKICWPLVLL
jgi:DNA-binding response OmpR family regulator